MTNNDKLWCWSAADLTAAIQKREISSREVVQSCLERLDEVNPIVNAIVEVHAEEALRLADAADDAVKRGAALGALHGVPVTTKVNVNQAGSATSNGVVAFADKIATEDSPVVANLKREGAVIIGRTSVPPFSWRWFTDSALYGRTLNPWNSGITCGGSSGGAAVAVATGMGPVAHGSDLAGSIRVPAYACGVFGMRPTLGRIPHYDGDSAPERPLLSQLFVSQGPLARSVADIRLGLQAMARHSDPRDIWSMPVPLVLDRTEPCRVAVFKAPAGQAVDPAVTEALEMSARALADAGYMVEEIAPPRINEVADLFLGTICEARAGLLRRIEELGDAPSRRAAASMAASAPEYDVNDYMKLLSRRSSLLREWQLFFQTYPLLLMPVSWSAPFVDDQDQHGDAAYAQILNNLAPTIAVNALGLPALAVPTGLVSGIPAGVQLVAGRFDEARCLSAGEVIEQQCSLSTPIDPVHELA